MSVRGVTKVPNCAPGCEAKGGGTLSSMERGLS